MLNNRFNYLEKESHSTSIFMMGWRLHRDMANIYGSKSFDEKYIDIMNNCMEDINKMLDVYENKKYLDGHMSRNIQYCIDETIFDKKK